MLKKDAIKTLAEMNLACEPSVLDPMIAIARAEAVDVLG